MTTHPTVQAEIDRLTARRSELMRRLAEEWDLQLRREREQVEARLEELWSLARDVRLRMIFGDRDAIIKRARQEERIERAA